MNVLNEVMTFAEATEYLEKNVNYLADMARAGKLVEGIHYRSAGRVKLITRSVVNQIKKGIFGVEKNFKEVGYWCNDKEIELVEIDGVVYALNDWNGKEYVACWRCIGEHNMEASNEEYVIRPRYVEMDTDKYEIMGYDVL